MTNLKFRNILKRASIFSGASLLVYSCWYYSASEYGSRIYSPDGRYYIQTWKVWTPNRLRAGMPGNGGDLLDGFVRLHSEDGIVVKEKFTTYLVGVEPRIYDNAFFGDVSWGLDNLDDGWEDMPYWGLFFYLFAALALTGMISSVFLWGWRNSHKSRVCSASLSEIIEAAQPRKL